MADWWEQQPRIMSAAAIERKLRAAGLPESAISRHLLCVAQQQQAEADVPDMLSKKQRRRQSPKHRVDHVRRKGRPAREKQ
jgi:hypothetical protein